MNNSKPFQSKDLNHSKSPYWVSNISLNGSAENLVWSPNRFTELLRPSLIFFNTGLSSFGKYHTNMLGLCRTCIYAMLIVTNIGLPCFPAVPPDDCTQNRKCSFTNSTISLFSKIVLKNKIILYIRLLKCHLALRFTPFLSRMLFTTIW